MQRRANVRCKSPRTKMIVEQFACRECYTPFYLRQRITRVWPPGNKKYLAAMTRESRNYFRISQFRSSSSNSSNHYRPQIFITTLPCNIPIDPDSSHNLVCPLNCPFPPVGTHRWKFIIAKILAHRDQTRCASRCATYIYVSGVRDESRVLSLSIMGRPRKQRWQFQWNNSLESGAVNVPRQRPRRNIRSFPVSKVKQLCPPDYEWNLISRELISLHTPGKDNTRSMLRALAMRLHFARFFNGIH